MYNVNNLNLFLTNNIGLTFLMANSIKKIHKIWYMLSGNAVYTG